MTQIPQGSDLWKEEALDSLLQSENPRGDTELTVELNAIYHALRAIAYALLAGPQPAGPTTSGRPAIRWPDGELVEYGTLAEAFLALKAREPGPTFGEAAP